MSEQPNVIIVGGGLGGLTAAILLERAGIKYHVFERAKEVKPLGAGIILNAAIQPVFEQLGILDAIRGISKKVHTIDYCKEDMERFFSFDLSTSMEATGYDSIVSTRGELYDTLLSQIPPSKITMGKKVMSIEQNDLGAMVRLNDGATHHCDILIGADGAYSAIRQCLYKRLVKTGDLPATDKDDLYVGFVCMVGTTVPLDPEKYPDLTNEFSKFVQVTGQDKPYAWTTLSVSGNRICWSAKMQIDSTLQSKDMMFKNSEWGSESNGDMIQAIRNFTNPFGGTLGDLIDATPEGLISKVYLEEKIFETWHGGRTVLIGDACHKMLPSAGMGAMNAMQDAVALVNNIYDLEANTPEAISKAFQLYYDERYSRAKQQYETSKIHGRLIYGQTLLQRAGRYVFSNWMPKSVLLKSFIKAGAYRPCAVFLPLPENRGIGHVEPQKPSKRYLQEQEDRPTSTAAFAL
ncbi:hypothetical protein BGZ58_002116 [Dissophora ornata]|nr:hypothetical protein BGZ58_002116 [Dissophora ornata]